MRILLLEDSPGEAELFCAAVVLAWEKLGSEPEAPGPGIDVQRTAKNALEFLRSSARQETNKLPDLIVLDLDLPGGTSLPFLHELRMDSRLATLPVIVMAWSDEPSIVRCLGGLGVVGYVVKPMRFDELVALVGGFCRHVLPENFRQEFCALHRKQHDDDSVGPVTVIRSRAAATVEKTGQQVTYGDSLGRWKQDGPEPA